MVLDCTTRMSFKIKDYQSNLNIFIFEHLYQVNTREFFTAEQGSVSITEAICLTHRKVGRDEYCHQKMQKC